MQQEYYIYKITCIPTEKSYVGQTQRLKHKNNKPFQYGIVGRWCDHVSSSKKSDTPLHVAIREYGIENFKQELVEVVTNETADEREGYWIMKYNTVHPNGFNVMTHSRCKHRDSSSIANLYLDKATGIELKQINKNNKPHMIYVYIDMPDERKRITFGQSKGSTFDAALEEAKTFVKLFVDKGIALKSADKADMFKDKKILGVRVTRFNRTMVAVYVKTENGQTRICFGGKRISYEDALSNAETFITRLNIESHLVCRQQVATLQDEAESCGDK
jgi:group I intron endonuclease